MERKSSPDLVFGGAQSTGVEEASVHPTPHVSHHGPAWPATPIRSITKDGGSVSLQGHENGRSFSIVIDAVTGKLSGAATEPGAGFLVFGTCVAR
jgi:hypothetical protein